MNQETKIPKLEPEELTKIGKEIYEEIKEKLESEQNGKYVAIEIKCKEYFIGETKEEALDKAQDAFPEDVFFIRKIGELERISSKCCLDFVPERYYDRLF